LIYFLDTNVLIDANRDYYPIKRVPEFWEWIEYMGNKGFVKIPIEIYEEIKEGNDDDSLAIWAKKPEIELALLFKEAVDSSLISIVVDKGYANDLSDDEVEKLGRDPFLIAYALKDIKQRCVVTTEVSKPKKLRANRRVPDVCDTFGISWCNTFKFIDVLNFCTNWKNQLGIQNTNSH
jgi:hypothetical protein